MESYVFRIGVFAWYPFLLIGRIKIMICLSQYLPDCYICLITFPLLLPPQHFHDFCFWLLGFHLLGFGGSQTMNASALSEASKLSSEDYDDDDDDKKEEDQE